MHAHLHNHRLPHTNTHTHRERNTHSNVHVRHPYFLLSQLRQIRLHPASSRPPAFPKSLSIPKLLVKRTKLENKTVWLTNKITCCLHLAVAIKALMTSEDGLLMWCLKAYQRFHNKIVPHAPLWQHWQPHRLSFFGPLCCLFYFVVSTSGIRYIEIFIIKPVATDTVIQVTLH